MDIPCAATTIGFVHDVTVNYDGGGANTIGSFTATTIVAQDLAQGLAEAINNTYLTYGYFASVGVESVTVYYNSAVGVNTNYVIGKVDVGDNITVPATLSDGTNGSEELEWNTAYHVQLAGEILARIGISLKDQQVEAYVERARADSKVV